ncbi:MAG: amino acid deaminase [Sphingobium sp.]|jgi:D-serine dehydratase|nr:amino acid deaminase [Sphingobium sp.]MCI1270967.1 amino acid deaminase [Sphingobium sp.]MCI1757002.1 amino acid deaminase [Sphingobium sp.]MCI2052499.1 amino acid deaminase [Sphingobium sp.]
MSTPSSRKLNAITKGLPHLAEPIEIAELSKQNWNILLEDVPLPVAVIRRSAIDRNRKAMMSYVREAGIELAPHGKTTLSPEIFAMQLDDGVWGITLSTIHQLRVGHAAGVKRILLANELVGPRDLDFVVKFLAENEDVDFYCFVDSVEHIERWADAASRGKLLRPINLLIELGYAGGRAGCRNAEDALTVASAISKFPQLCLQGIAGFEGLRQYLPAEEAQLLTDQFLEYMKSVIQTIDARGLFGGEEIILTAGGSALFDIVAKSFRALSLSKPSRIIIRSGCYVTHDSGIYERHQPARLVRQQADHHTGPALDSAIEVWTYVISVPETGRAILGAGRRDFGHDAGPPRALKSFRPGSTAGMQELPQTCEIVSINDQHAHLAFPADVNLAIGDMVALGISHPCTTFDRWTSMLIVDDAYNVESAITTHF